MSDQLYPRARRMGANGSLRQFDRRRFLGGAGVLGAGLAATAVVGCSDDDDDAEAGGETPTTRAAAGETPTSSAPEELIIAMQAEPDDLMPFYGGFDQMIALRAVNETLMNVVMTERPGGGADVAFEPVLAESWEQVGDTTFTFNLRPGVRFHDGEPWNAEAAVVAAEAFSDGDAVGELGKFAMMPRYVSSVEAVDELTFQVETLYPLIERELFGFAFYFGYAAFSPRALDEMGMRGMGDAPVGTGPYRFDRWERGQSIRLVRNDDYWGGAPPARELTFIARPEASVRAQTISSGEAHLAFNIGSEQASALENSVVGGGFQSNSLRLNNRVGPTTDQRVREAINFALDRDGINEAIFQGTATPIGFFGYQANVQPWPYDPEQARALVEDAGVVGEEVELVYGELRIPEEDALAEIFKAQIDAIGLDVRLTRLERRQYSEVDQGPVEDMPPMFMETTSGGNYGELSLHLGGFYGCEDSSFCNEDLESEFDEILMLDGEERDAWVEAMAARLQEDHAPRAWTLAVNQVHGLAPGVEADLALNVYVRVLDLGFA